jgi:phage terminase large subunit-like protein
MSATTRAAALSALTPERRARFLGALSDTEAATLLYHWEFWARPAQLPPPGGWRVWLIRAGRGFGKTRAGAEWVRAQIEGGRARRVALVGETAADARDVMVEGESGLLAIAPPWCRPRYEPSKRRLTWPNGAIATTYSADDPEQLRGPQHDAAWADEVAKWRHADAWDQLMLGLRLGRHPRCVATTTPRPKRWIRAIMDDPAAIATAGTTFDNAANLAPAFLAHMQARHGGTRLGRQELLGEYLDDLPGALWTRALIERARVVRPPELARVVVAIDPAAGAGAGADETGIIVAALGRDQHGYVLADLSGRLSPDQWARRAVAAARDFRAERIVAERNNGGDMVGHVLRTVDPNASLSLVWASRGKAARAEPVAALYEQGRVHHAGAFPQLEDQMASFAAENTADQDGHMDRLDALVWGLSDLMLGPAPAQSREFRV